MIRKVVSLDDIKLNDDNPRTIKDAEFKKLVKSLKEFPEMIEAREVVVNTEGVILGGNMRYRAARSAGLEKIPVKVVDWPEEKQREFIIKDNVSNGDWDWEALANDWDSDLLDDWGVIKVKDIDFNNIKSNADRVTEKQAIKVRCPSCGEEFEV